MEKQWQYFQERRNLVCGEMYLKWWLSAAAVVLALVVTDILLNEWYFVDLSLENTVPVARQVRSDEVDYRDWERSFVEPGTYRYLNKRRASCRFLERSNT